MPDRPHTGRMTLSDQIRQRVRDRLGVCPTCHRPGDEQSLRSVCREAGLAPSTLWRFLVGKQMRTDGLDRLVAWLDQTDKKAKR